MTLFAYAPGMRDDEKEHAFLVVLLKHGPPPWEGIHRSQRSTWARPYKKEAHRYLYDVTQEFAAAIAASAAGQMYTPVGLDNRARMLKNEFMEWCLEQKEIGDCNQNSRLSRADGGADD